MNSSPSVGPLLQRFFLEHLRNHKGVSPQTVAAYRDAFRLLFTFLQHSTGTEPSALQLSDLDAPAILAFLDHLERGRNNTARSRNARLAAIRSFFRYVALREPDYLGIATQVLAIPNKRAERHMVGYLSRAEIEALLVAPDRSRWAGRRDHALLLTLYNTGARVSEIASLTRVQLCLALQPSVQLHGKGRKDRVVPLWSRTARVLKLWLDELGDGPGNMVFPNAQGSALSRHGVAYIVERAVRRASSAQPSLVSKRVSPHVFRHTTAMHLLQAGVDLAVIALWLGHESVETTHVYVEADLAMKEQALDKLAPVGPGVPRFKANDSLLSFLEQL